ncbi:hypothetical protein JY651_17875 [Pyxidicoccus parkwayensis]|uniref:Uncharacterized protein n=1 Tax=Pyxidicoccus parkwayensis TaxID=2813578 RepID=A0ABX7P8A5_9BACT|nr:hypothetical protein [Pyxidicoccus parkwaysis]QSQ26681.1 hypothetical protein JY651_17875 [Pyxidicoccus parkwaysis]
MRTVPTKRMSLLTEREAQLVLSSAPRNLSELSPRELRSRIQRTRRLMEKYQDQARQQRREALGRVAPSRSRRAEGNVNTRQKAEYFARTLERFEKRLAKLEAEATRVRSGTRVTRVTRTTRGTRRGTARRAVALGALARGTMGGRKPARRTRAAGRTATARGASRQKKGGALKQQRFPSVKRQSHASARGRRTQTRKDQRR